MEITLQTVRDVLRANFGKNSFVASFIKQVHQGPDTPTASIDAQGVLRYNPKFVQKHVSTTHDLFCLIAHEMMHALFGHFVHGQGKLENIAGDLVINACICRLYEQSSDNGSLFRKFYEPIGIQGLLRPGSNMNGSRYWALYNDFYNSSAQRKLSTGEVLQTLKILNDKEESEKVVLLGSHGNRAGKESQPGKGNDLPHEVVSQFADDLKNAIQHVPGKGIGFGDSLYELLVHVIESKASIKKTLLQKFATKQKLNNFLQSFRRPRVSASPIPLRISKRDLVMLASGVPPFHYHNRSHEDAKQKCGLVIYLDVSGSVNEHLPEIIGLLQDLKMELKSILLFSNKVVEIPFKSLLAGKVETTYGTDFDCIAQHVLDNHVDKAIVLTDGYANMNEQNRDQLKKCKFRSFTILFANATECRCLANFGDVVTLKEVTV